jgi:hypothetical protein
MSIVPSERGRWPFRRRLGRCGARAMGLTSALVAVRERAALKGGQVGAVVDIGAPRFGSTL